MNLRQPEVPDFDSEPDSDLDVNSDICNTSTNTSVLFIILLSLASIRKGSQILCMYFIRRFFACLMPVLLVFVPVAVASFGEPEGFLTEETVRETLLYPGVVWYEVVGRDSGQPQVVHIVTVAIDEPHLRMKSLLGERFVNQAGNQFFRRSQVSHLQADNDSLVAINTAFFDISNTMAPRGLIIQDQQIYKQPEPGRVAFLYSEQGIPYIGNFTFRGTVRHGESSRSLIGINPYTLSGAQLGLYRQPWDRSPGSTGSFSGNQKTEVVVEELEFISARSPGELSQMRGRVIEVRDQQEPVVIEQGHFVLSGAGTTRALLLPMKAGDMVEVEWQLQGRSEGLHWNDIVEATPGSSFLVNNGVRQTSSIMNTDHWNNRHPRSAMGISEDQKQLLIMLVEGRQSGRAAGMSLHRVGEYMLHLGALNALEFDGGGSSSIVAKVDGAARRLNTPSDGSERYVPAGLGVQVVQEESNAFFKDVRISADADLAVVSWATAEPAAARLRYGRARLDHYSADSGSTSTRHSATINALQAGKVHYARIVAQTRTGQEVSELLTIPFSEDGGEPGGVPHWWLSHHFGEDIPDVAVDVDGDGQTVYEEFVWGTDPTNPKSRLRKQMRSAEDGHWYLEFAPYLSTRSYALWSRSDLNDGEWIETGLFAIFDPRQSKGYFEWEPGAELNRQFFHVKAEIITVE